MSFRQKQLMAGIQSAQKRVDEERASLQKTLDSADHSIAAIKCDDLKAALLQLNELECKLADLDG